MKKYISLLIASLVAENSLFAAEAGMPQLNPKYWASQGFWLVVIFTFLYFSISKIFIPKIKNNIENRDNKIKKDLDEAKLLQETAEEKQKEYLKLIEDAKLQVKKIITENKNKLSLEISNKKKNFEDEINKEIQKAEKEILSLKKNSLNDVKRISEELASAIVEDVSGTKLNESSIKANVLEVSKNKLSKYL